MTNTYEAAGTQAGDQHSPDGGLGIPEFLRRSADGSGQAGTPILTPATPADPLCDLVAQLNSAHEAIASAPRQAVAHAIAAGIALDKIKKRIDQKMGRGHWVPWLREKCPIPPSTAQFYRWVSKNEDRVREAEISNALDFSLRGLRRLLGKSRTPALPPPKANAEYGTANHDDGDIDVNVAVTEAKAPAEKKAQVPAVENDAGLPVAQSKAALSKPPNGKPAEKPTKISEAKFNSFTADEAEAHITACIKWSADLSIPDHERSLTSEELARIDRWRKKVENKKKEAAAIARANGRSAVSASNNDTALITRAAVNGASAALITPTTIEGRAPTEAIAGATTAPPAEIPPQGKAALKLITPPPEAVTPDFNGGGTAITAADLIAAIENAVEVLNRNRHFCAQHPEAAEDVKTDLTRALHRVCNAGRQTIPAAAGDQGGLTNQAMIKQEEMSND
jgi:hypothetical protein